MTTQQDLDTDYNCTMDTTFIGEIPDNYDGLENMQENEGDEESKIISALALRKNLVSTFDQHATAKEDCGLKETSRHHGAVKAKIQAFEQGTIKGVATANNRVTAEGQASLIEIDSSQINMNMPNRKGILRGIKPPVGPPKAVQGAKVEHPIESTRTTALLTVYLRIRPTSKGSENQEDTDMNNTVEIIVPQNNRTDDRHDIRPASFDEATKIRTYPPISSNAAKVARGSQNSNLNIVFNHLAPWDSTGLVKGVKEYEFSRVFGPSSSQHDVYTTVAAPLVDGLFPACLLPHMNTKSTTGQGAQTAEHAKLVGNSALLFAYGITNAGKTHTIIGDMARMNAHSSILRKDDQEAGIIPRTIHHIIQNMELVEKSSVQQENVYCLFLSYFEIYNEQIYDLLPLDKKSRTGQSSQHPTFGDETLKIRETRNGRTYVEGLAKHRIKDLVTGLELIKSAMNKRHTSSNNINRDSSRSHSICQLELVAMSQDRYHKVIGSIDDEVSVISEANGYSTDEDTVTTTTCSRSSLNKRSVKMWIVDLAGSERLKRTGIISKSSRQKEAALINASLMKLMRCVQIISDNQKSSSSLSSIVPFRESKLTYLLMDHLIGAPASRTSMIVNINPCVDDYDETQHVLSYAAVARSVRITEADYVKKRRAIQINKSDLTKPEPKCEDEHKSKKAESLKSPPRKIARLVQKLSPRALLAKRKEELSAQARRAHQLKANDGLAQKAQETSGDKEIVCLDPSTCSLKCKLEQENDHLRSKLEASEQSIDLLRSQNLELNKKLESCEAKIRMEVAEETEAHIAFLREQNTLFEDRIKLQYQSVPVLSKSAIKAKSDKAASIIEDLMEKVDECEDEMERMRTEHENEVLNLKALHFNEIESRDEVICDLKQKLFDAISERERLIRDLDQARKERDVVTEQNDKLLSDSSKLSSSQQSSSDQDEESFDEDECVQDEKENLSKEHTTRDSSINAYSPDAPKSLRRLPRPRCSEVACANISPNSIKPDSIANLSSSSKKRHGIMSSLSKTKDIRSPFKSISGKTNTVSSDQRTSSIVTSDNRLDDESDLLYPLSQPEYDEITKRYQRPRGRAPAGRSWDSLAGGWRLIQ